MAAKKRETIEIPADRPKSARREARARVGPVPPARPIPPATRKPPKHKKKSLDEDAG
jgi:hypothetical protein